MLSKSVIPKCSINGETMLKNTLLILTSVLGISFAGAFPKADLVFDRSNARGEVHYLPKRDRTSFTVNQTAQLLHFDLVRVYNGTDLLPIAERVTFDIGLVEIPLNAIDLQDVTIFETYGKFNSIHEAKVVPFVDVILRPEYEYIVEIRTYFDGSFVTYKDALENNEFESNGIQLKFHQYNLHKQGEPQDVPISQGIVKRVHLKLVN